VATRFAFVGFRHPHINDMFARCQQRDDIEIVACCEEDQTTRETLAAEGKVEITHDNFTQMLAEVESDVIAVGDYYGKRGSLTLEALRANRHVISDKPICISLWELDEIQQVAADQHKLVGCMFDMRDSPVYLGLRKLIRGGEIGKVHAIAFGGQHALNYHVRPGWYYEEGKHGGTINDIAIHAIDGIPWITGREFSSVDSARCWNATRPEIPHFKECAQAMLQLEGGAGVVCDVSYLSPDSFLFSFPLYWRFTFWGEKGVVEAGYNSSSLTLYKNGEKEARQIALPDGKPGGYLDAFLQELHGEPGDLHLSSAEALRASRTALIIQEAADQQNCHVALGQQ